MLPNLTGTPWVDVVLVSAALLGALGVIWKKGIKPVSRWVRSSWRNVKHAIEIGSNLVEIAHEFQPNGGGSLRDAIDRVETQGQEVKTALDEHLFHSATRDAEVASIAADQAAHAAVDAESFAEVKGAVSTVQGAVDTLTDIVTRRLEDRTLPAQVSAEATVAGQETP